MGIELPTAKSLNFVILEDLKPKSDLLALLYQNKFPLISALLRRVLFAKFSVKIRAPVKFAPVVDKSAGTEYLNWEDELVHWVSLTASERTKFL